MKQRLRDLESKDLWIQARVDELMDDDEWLTIASDDCTYPLNKATEQATREHAEIEAMILDAQIDNLELK